MPHSIAPLALLATSEVAVSRWSAGRHPHKKQSFHSAWSGQGVTAATTANDRVARGLPTPSRPLWDLKGKFALNGKTVQKKQGCV